MKEPIFALIFGIIGTVLFHVGKSMQKQGIGFLSIIRKKISGNDAAQKLSKSDIRHGFLYLTGIILNNTLAFWIMLANLFAPSSYFSSMFGIGIIALMIYSRSILQEAITRNK